MARVIISVQPAVAHLYPTIQLATDLRQRGHFITFVTSEEWPASYVRDQGFASYRLDWELPEIEEISSRTTRILSSFRSVRRIRREIVKILSDGKPLRALMRELRPDLVLIDSTISLFAMPLVAWKIPVAMISPVLPLDRDRNVPPLTSHQVPSSTVLSCVRSRLAWHWHILSRRCAALVTGVGDIQPAKKVAEHYHIAFSEAVNVDRSWPTLRVPELILCPKAFDFDRPERLDRFYADSSVRPDKLQSEVDEEFPWRRIRDDIPVVYCSFGSRVPEQNRAKRLLASIIRAFCAELNVQLVVKLHSDADTCLFKNIPPHMILVTKWTPQMTILRRAAVHITHGGFMSVRESIECEVPMLAIPFDSDQPGNAARIVHHGLGLRIKANCATGQKVVHLTRILLQSSRHRENVRRMKAEFALQRNHRSAADVVETILSQSKLSDAGLPFSFASDE